MDIRTGFIVKIRVGYAYPTNIVNLLIPSVWPASFDVRGRLTETAEHEMIREVS